jgi:hypothetical protein
MARASAAASTPSEPLRLRLDAEQGNRPDLLDELKSVFEHNKGDALVYVAIADGEGSPSEWKLGEGYRVRNSGKLHAELNQVLGPNALAA